MDALGFGHCLQHALQCLSRQRNGFRILPFEMKTSHKHRKEGWWARAGIGSQSYVFCNVCPFFEEHAMHLGAKERARALQCGQNWQPELRFIPIFDLSLQRWMHLGSGIACKHAMQCVSQRASTFALRTQWLSYPSTFKWTNTGRRDGGQRPELHFTQSLTFL